MFPHNKFNLVCKFFCLAPISSNIHTQRFLYTYSLITIFCLILATAFSFSINVFGEGYIVSSLATSVVFLSGIIGHITTVLESLLKRKEHESFFGRLQELEDIFRLKLQHRIQVGFYRKKLLWKYSILSILIVVSLTAYIYIISVRDYQGYFWSASLSVIVARIRFIQVSIYVDLISFQFDSMNLLLKQITKSRIQHKNRILEEDYDLIDNTERIFVLKLIYTKLNDLVICLNEAFGWSILTLTVYFSLDLTCNIYWLFLTWEALLVSYSAYESYTTIFPIGLLLFLLSYTCSMCSNKSDVSKTLVHQMLVDSTLDQTNYLLDAFLLQIYNQPIGFHAKRFFYINLKLLTSVSFNCIDSYLVLCSYLNNPQISASMLGYLVILIQFQLTENEL
ncbi:putative gustatory receptor 39b [Episyrphus balteatus]|uniref:putative gustatory receptor 39b n=1 Tax=Episyrphus balteatus TaxID=286459 RepID=UPI0024853D3D|nr:putative gustatory receptor 39b [Episyrphus balteatus]